ncbi:MAG: KEOPS complex subunit Pcc1 [Candidatus Micrarchaeia archaeon]
MAYECTLRLAVPDPDGVVAAIGQGDEHDRCKSRVSVDKGEVVVYMSATDLTALRASFNEHARLLRVCESVERLLK